MKKVCHITTVHPSFDKRIFHKECKTLAKAGYDVILIAQHEKDEVVDKIKIIALPKPKNGFERILFSSQKAYKLALKQKVDIYHFHDPEFLPWAIKLKKKTGTKIIYDVHEDYPEQILSKHWIPKFLKKIISRVFNFYEKKAAQNFDLIITATPDIKKNFGEMNADDIKNYPIILDSKFFGDSTAPKVKNYYNLIYVGGLERVRGIKEIIQSLKFINPKYNVKLKLAGNFPDKNFKNEVKKLKEWSRVEFLGWIPFEKMIETVSDIGLVCLHPLKRFLTSLPVKMFEYMAAGIPIIASNFPLWKEIVEKNGCGICVNPLDPKEIARAIEYLIEHPEETKKMGENGKKAVLEKYNWENEGKKLLEVYGKVTK